MIPTFNKTSENIFLLDVYLYIVIAVVIFLLLDNTIMCRVAKKLRLRWDSNPQPPNNYFVPLEVRRAIHCATEPLVAVSYPYSKQEI